ncbi:hypothetical protein J6X73_00875 [Candidatus Saccharibacteria bacterium]|nr:hypothetical protein [Candidatus Saccharibacteria bacterium]
MAEKAKKPTNTKTIKTNGEKEAVKSNASKFAIFGIAVVAIIAVVIAVVVAFNASPAINDAYFVSDGSKYVLNIENEDDEDGAVAVHIVYYYSGNTVTDAKSFYEFADEATAKAAFEELKAANEEASSYALNGKYVVISADKEDIKDMTAEDVKAQIEFYESLKNLSDSDDEE